MSVEEIKIAIYKLNSDERRELIQSLVPKAVRPTPDDLKRSQAIFDDNNSGDKWVSWRDLKSELGH